MMPPERKTTVENNTARVAVATESSLRRVSRNAITTVAKTSKKPSTQRCTTHHRQYSAVDQIAALAVHQPGGVKQRDGDARQKKHQEQGMVFVAPR